MVTKKSKRKIALTPYGSDAVTAVSDAAVDDAAGLDHSPSPSPSASDDEEDVGVEGGEEEEVEDTGTISSNMRSSNQNVHARQIDCCK